MKDPICPTCGKKIPVRGSEAANSSNCPWCGPKIHPHTTNKSTTPGQAESNTYGKLPPPIVCDVKVTEHDDIARRPKTQISKKRSARGKRGSNYRTNRVIVSAIVAVVLVLIAGTLILRDQNLSAGLESAIQMIAALLCLVVLVGFVVGLAIVIASAADIAAKSRQQKAAEALAGKLRQDEEQQRLQSQRIAQILEIEKAVGNEPLAISVFEMLCEIDAGFRVSSPDNLAFLLSKILVKIDSLETLRIFPIFTEYIRSIFDLYQKALVLSQSNVNEFQVIGGGFGLKGAAKGILAAEAVNWVSRQFSNTQIAKLFGQIQELVVEARKNLESLRSIMNQRRPSQD